MYRMEVEAEGLKMSTRTNVTYRVPLSINDQITIRAALAGRSRNDEVRQLLADGLGFAEERDFLVEIPEEQTTRKVVWIDHELASRIYDRAKKVQRDVSTEMQRLLVLALQSIADRDIALIQEMMRREGLTEPSR
jgi:plasmid stability protein